MPVSLFLDPKEFKRRGRLSYHHTPLLAYERNFSDEISRFGSGVLKEIYADMVLIREFERMFARIREKGEYRGVKHKYAGPAHLYIGQESVAVGQALHLKVEDVIFGTHRNHGEVLAKAMKSIRILPEKILYGIMEHYLEGEPLRILEKNSPKEVRTDIKSLSEDFILYLLTSELFGKKTGCARGLSNSMHLFFEPFGIGPSNAIVGASAPLAAGAALYKKETKQSGIVIANLGDGALGCGPVWESMNFAAMDQFTTLWEKGYTGGLKLLFFFINNGYGMGGQTDGETMAYRTLARVGAGINPDQLHSERVDGFDPLAVADAVGRKKKILEGNKGPAMLDIVSYRFCAHSASDTNAYRSEEERNVWLGHDCIAEYEEKLFSHSLMEKKEPGEIKEKIRGRILRALTLACDEQLSPRMDLKREKDAIARYTFSNLKEKVSGDPKIPYPRSSREEEIEKKSRSGRRDGKILPPGEAVTLSDALFESILHRFKTDPSLVAYGQENREWGGTFGVYRGLSEILPYHKLFNAPISEAAIVGSAVGYALSGGRVLAELMYCDFIGRAGDEIINQLAKWQAMSGGILKMPAVLRMAVGSKYGAQHSQDLSALAAHIPGLKIIYPATPYDAKGLLSAALAGSDPVLCFESQRVYDEVEIYKEGGVPEGYYEIPLGKGDVKIEGRDVTIVAVGGALSRAASAVRALKEKFHCLAELFDPRTLSPFDYDGLLKSVAKTGRLVLVGDACERGSFFYTVAGKVTRLLFETLKAAPVVLGAKNTIVPCIELEEEYFPGEREIVAAVNEVFPLEGYDGELSMTRDEFLEWEQRGI